MSINNALALTECMLLAGPKCATMRRPEGVSEMGERYEELAVVRFEGGRFASHKREVELIPTSCRSSG